MITNSDLGDLVRSAPPELTAVLERASDAFYALDMDLATELITQAARTGFTTWHARAGQIADELEFWGLTTRPASDESEALF